MRKKILCLSLLISLAKLNAQTPGVAINETHTGANAAAMLDVSSTNKGVLVPRVALTATNNNSPIGSGVVASLLVYNTATTGDVTPGYYYWNGTIWTRLVDGSALTSIWSLNGNANTTAGTNFLGTTDSKDLVFKTNNTEYMRLTSAGHLAIGSTSASSMLKITQQSNSYASGQLIYGSGSVNGQYIALSVLGSQQAQIQSGDASTWQNLLLNPSGGNVGIGTTSPSYPLHVYSSVNGLAYHAFENGNTGSSVLAGALAKTNAGMAGFQIASTAGGSWAEFGSSGSGGIYYSIWNNAGDHIWRTTGSNVERMRLTSAGTVGIGTASPEVTLHVATESTNAQRGVIIQLSGDNTSSESLILRKTRGTIAAPTAVQNGDNLGNVYPEGYDGSTYLRTGAGIKFLSNGTVATGSIPTDISITTGAANPGTEVMRLTNGGKVGIGCSTPQYALHVIGDIASSGTVRGVNAYVTGAITACSDIRYKKNITTLQNALNNILAMNGVNYFWKTAEFPDKNFTNEKQIGFIAQDLEKIYPELVLTDKDGYKSVDYSRLTPILVEAIKEQQKIIVANQQKDNEQQKEIDELKAMVNKLTYMVTSQNDLKAQAKK